MSQCLNFILKLRGVVQSTMKGRFRSLKSVSTSTTEWRFSQARIQVSRTCQITTHRMSRSRNKVIKPTSKQAPSRASTVFKLKWGVVACRTGTNIWTCPVSSAQPEAAQPTSHRAQVISSKCSSRVMTSHVKLISNSSCPWNKNLLVWVLWGALQPTLHDLKWVRDRLVHC